MTDLQLVGIELTKHQVACGTTYTGLLETLAPQLAAAELLDWAQICRAIAAAGWHGWESTNRYLALSPALLAAGGPRLLLATGHYGLGLSGSSIEPGISYFAGVETLLAAQQLPALAAIEGTGRVFSGKYTHASNLLASYFNTAFGVAGNPVAGNPVAGNPVAGIPVAGSAGAMPAVGTELDHWLALADGVVHRERADVLQFFNLSQAATAVSWAYVQRLDATSAEAATAYLQACQRLAQILSKLQLERLQARLLYYAAADSALGLLLVPLVAQLPLLAYPERDNLLAMFERLDDLQHAVVVLAVVPRLPMADLRILQTWLNEALFLVPQQPQAALAYLGLESSTSVVCLESLQGQVCLADCQRLLQFYTEAFVGTRLRLVSSDEAVDGPNLDAAVAALASTDGAVIVLPAVAADYASRQQNFGFYKVALLHQLGFYEFGTFNFRYANNPLAFSAFFRRFSNPALAQLVFRLLEDARVDWQLTNSYRGIRRDLDWLKADARQRRADVEVKTATGRLLEALVLAGLDQEISADVDGANDIAQLQQQLLTLELPGASIWDTMLAVKQCYALVVQATPAAGQDSFWLEVPRQVNFRGVIEPDKVSINLQLGLLDDEDLEIIDDDAESLGLSVMLNPGDVDVENMKQAELESAGMLLKEMHRLPDEIKKESSTEGAASDDDTLKALLAGHRAPDKARVFHYDEWDCVMHDYRRRWCTLYEVRDVDEDPTFVDNAMQSLRGVADRVRRQLNRLRPEMLAKVRGQTDGEELDMEKAIEAIVDRKAGLSPEERIYVQKQRKVRDVSALFLLDMSASTDDPIPDPNAVVAAAVHVDPDSQDYLRDYYAANAPAAAAAKPKRIIDLEKEAVVLMSEALQDLGDNYAICGFSGYGREQVEYFVHKDFTEPYNRQVKDKIGGIKPCRSTRMGPAIRHASKQLLATESRIKALIILSDGYPQDFDYGKDRNSRVYGVKDTARALAEARQQGISAFCLTVDPSGHDYLREMCPDQQYMVIQDINDLPGELSKVYRGLTG